MFTLSLGTLLFGQQGENDIVYAGRNFTWGMNMGSFDLAILLREGGTFCETLEAPDWQTKIEGRHRKVKAGILLEYLDKATANDTIFIEKDITDGYEYVNYGGAQMIKMTIPNKVPEGFYEYNSASSSRGMGTGMVYLGTQHNEGYKFYVNGTFNKSSAGGVMVSDGNIGGGTNSEGSSKGSYTIQNGLLTLTYENGTTEKNSFFYSEPNEDGTFSVALNGSIFFAGRPEKGKDENLDSITHDKYTTETTTNTDDTSDTNILEKVKIAHGGIAIDSLTHMEATMETAEINFKVLIDLERKFLRLESLTPNFSYIEQLENETGWVFQNGAVTEMASDRVLEIQNTFSTGLFLLQKEKLETITILETRQNANGFKVLKVYLDGQISGLIVDTSNYRLIGTAKFNAEGNEITYLSEFKTVNGILIPFKEEVETETQDIVITYSTYMINPDWESGVWDRPN